MEKIFEILLIIALITGLCCLVFDVKLVKVGSIILFLAILIGLGFFIGIGVHFANLAFHW